MDPSRTGSAPDLGEAKLTTIHAIGSSLAIGPIFSVGALTALIAAFAGASTPASVFLATIGALGLAYLVSLFARRFAGAGAIYEYLFHAAGATVGLLAGGLYFIGLPVIMGSFSIIFGILSNGFWAEHIASNAPSFWIFSLCFLVFIGLMNYYGVRLAVRGILVLAALSAVPVLLLAAVIIAKGGAEGQSLVAFSPFHGDTSGILNGVLFALTLFIGFEAAASIAEETEKPRRSIPIAMISVVAISAAFYMIVTYAMSIGFGVSGLEAWVGSPSPLGNLAETYVGDWLATVIGLAIIFDLVSVGLAFFVTACRGFYALSRDGFLPKALGRTSRFGTPVGGLLAVLVIAGLTLLWAATTHLGDQVGLPNPFQAFLIMVAAGSFVIEAIYVALALAGFRIVYELGNGVRDWWRYLIVLAGLAAPVLAFKGALDPWPQSPEIGIYIALGMLALATVWTVALRITRPELVVGAASHALAEHEMTMGSGSVEQLQEPVLER